MTKYVLSLAVGVAVYVLSLMALPLLLELVGQITSNNVETQMGWVILASGLLGFISSATYYGQFREGQKEVKK